MLMYLTHVLANLDQTAVESSGDAHVEHFKGEVFVVAVSQGYHAGILKALCSTIGGREAHYEGQTSFSSRNGDGWMLFCIKAEVHLS